MMYVLQPLDSTRVQWTPTHPCRAEMSQPLPTSSPPTNTYPPARTAAMWPRRPLQPLSRQRPMRNRLRALPRACLAAFGPAHAPTPPPGGTHAVDQGGYLRCGRGRDTAGRRLTGRLPLPVLHWRGTRPARPAHYGRRPRRGRRRPPAAARGCSPPFPSATPTGSCPAPPPHSRISGRRRGGARTSTLRWICAPAVLPALLAHRSRAHWLSPQPRPARMPTPTTPSSNACVSEAAGKFQPRKAMRRKSMWTSALASTHPHDKLTLTASPLHCPGLSTTWLKSLG
jgi:hypothetical protein